MMADAQQAPSARRIFLVGLMGAGKTTVGRRLAEALQLEFVDSDHEIERRTGASIPLIFDVEGEAGFRRREAAVIDELTQRRGVVLATGGGAVLDPANRRHLAERGLVIYLSASLEQLWRRTSRDRNRPLLQTQDPRAKLKQLMVERDPLYREIADVVVATDKRGVRHVVAEILGHPALSAKS
ncbi:shikimate kinase AroK [Ectothiorhodospiraceae bacterium 2226]|nr:shikimate kinase AroK [Ectothiorhodospiraceae bacterium 2226]